MKPIKAWALVDAGSDRLVAYDHRLPITWLRKIAVYELGTKCIGTDRIVRVEIREVPKKARR